MARYEYRPGKTKRARPHVVRWSTGSGAERRQAQRSFEKKTEALRFKAGIEARGTARPLDRRTVQQAAREWMLARWDTWSPNRRESVDGELRRHIIPIIGDVKVSKLERRHAENVLRARREGHQAQVIKQMLTSDPAKYSMGRRTQYPPVGPASERKTLEVLSGLCRWLVEDQMALERNPVVGIRRRPIANQTKYRSGAKVTEADLPSAEDIEKLCVEIRQTHPDLELLIVLVAYLGLRPGEALALQVSDVVLESRISGPHVTVTKTRGDTPTRFTDNGQRGGMRPPKTNEHRDVPLSEDMAAKLRDHLGQAKKRSTGQDRRALFIRPDGRPVTADWFRKRVLNPAREGAGLEDAGVGLRELRHFGVTVWLRAFDGDVARACRVTGHKAEVMLNVYAGIVDSFSREGASAHAKALADLGVRNGTTAGQT